MSMSIILIEANKGGLREMYGRRFRKGIIAAAFGVGLLMSCFCPTELLVSLLAIIVICLGLSCVRC